MFWIFMFFVASCFFLYKSVKTPGLTFFFLSLSILSILFTAIMGIVYYENTKIFECEKIIKVENIINVKRNQNGMGIFYTTTFSDKQGNEYTTERIIKKGNDFCLNKKVKDHNYFIFSKKWF